MKTLLQQALELRELLGDKKRWTAGRIAEDEIGSSVSFCDPAACQFCLVGGIAKVVHECGVHDVDEESAYQIVNESSLGLLVAEVIKGIRGRDYEIPPDTEAVSDEIHPYNDNVTHERVMEVVHTTVAMAQGAGV